MFRTNAEVKVKDAQGKIVDSQPYEKVVFEGTGKDSDGKIVSNKAADVLLGEAISFFQTVVGEKGNGVTEMLSQVTYAYDLGVRAGIRQGLIAATEGPEKAIAKMVKDYMAARAASGRPVTEEQAKTKVLASLED